MHSSAAGPSAGDSAARRSEAVTNSAHTSKMSGSVRRVSHLILAMRAKSNTSGSTPRNSGVVAKVAAITAAMRSTSRSACAILM